MRIKNLISALSVCLAVTSVQAAPTANSPTDFTLSSPVHAPGVTLNPGAYTIQVLSRLSDRVILRVDSTKGDVHTTFLGIQNNEIQKPANSGPVTWANPAGRGNYLKGWSFPNSQSVIEFVYPKAEAVSIATANPAKVPAVDPASEGKVTDQSLSQDDMQMLTLWLLSLQEVGPGAPSGGIKAERYQLVASTDYKPAIKSLPHTASFIPVIWISGLAMLLAACCLRGVRMMQRPRL